MILHVVSLLILTVFIIEVYILTILIKWSLSYLHGVVSIDHCFALGEFSIGC